MASFGFEVERSPESRIIVSRIDSASDAFTKGIRTGMEILGWNRLPVNDALQKIKTRRYRKLFQDTDEDQVRLLLLPRSRPGETAEVFILTGTGNNRGIRLIAR